MFEYEQPYGRFGDAEDRAREDEWAEHLEHQRDAVAERLSEHRPFRPDPKPTAKVRRKDAPKPDVLWRQQVFERDQGCVVHENPADCEWPPECHHVLPAQLMRREGLALHLWRRDAGVQLCSLAHRQHHNRVRPIFLEELPTLVVAFVRETNLSWYLDRHYPRREQAAA